MPGSLAIRAKFHLSMLKRSTPAWPLPFGTTFGQLLLPWAHHRSRATRALHPFANKPTQSQA